MPVKQLLAYVPVVHAGYQRFFTSHSDADELLLLGTGFAAVFPQLGKDIRAVAPETAARYIRLDLPDLAVRVVEPDELPGAVVADVLVVPDEELMHDIVQQCALDEDRQVVYDTTFLRWDRTWSLEERPVDYDGAVSADVLAVTIMTEVSQEGLRSSDWWRRVGAAVVLDGRVVRMQHNRHLPTDYTPYLDGDPRNEFHRGVRPDLSTAIHAEALLIAQCARDGWSTAGADIYVSAFPCPPCSRLIANAEFRRCYFRGSYGSLDGEQVLRDAGVELIWVDTGSTGSGSPPTESHA